MNLRFLSLSDKGPRQPSQMMHFIAAPGTTLLVGMVGKLEGNDCLNLLGKGNSLHLKPLQNMDVFLRKIND